MTENGWYEGREQDAEWRVAAADRIDEHRKADLTVRVLDDGTPIEDAEVTIEQREHAFGFGSMADAGLLLDEDDEYGSETAEQFREAFERLFNRATINYGFYPWQWGDPDEDMQEIGIEAVDWLNERGYPVHGHTTLWNEEGRALPDVEEMTDPTAIRERLREHVRDEVGTLAGRVDEWDVINHPVWLNDIWEDRLNADRSDWIDWLDAAREADPETDVFINEEAIRDQDVARANDEAYYEMLTYLIEHDAPVDGAGFMGHFTPETLVPPAEVVAWFDRYAKYDVALQITEFDVAAGWFAENVDGQLPDVDDDEWRSVQADYTRDFLTAVVSHPAITAFITWGFWEGRMWRPDGAFVSEDFELTSAGQAYVDLVYDEWWTETSGRTDADGNLTVRGFKGTYDVRAKTEDEPVATTVTLDGDESTIVIDV